MDDFVFNARQIGQYPFLVQGVNPVDLVLVQQGGIGGPYASVQAAGLVATAMTVGGFIQMLSVTGGIRFADVGQFMTFGSGQFEFSAAVAAPSMNTDSLTINGETAATEPFVNFAILDVNQRLEFLALNTVRTFNGRVGNVQLELIDILRGGGAPNDNPHFGGTPRANSFWDARVRDDRLVTAEWVHRAFCFDLEQWLRIQPVVFTFNGRGGNVVLSTQDVNDAYFTIDGVVPRAPNPPLNDASTRIATTAFVDTALQDLEQNITIQLSELGQSVFDFLNEKYAPLDSPQFVGIPAGPTANPGTATGQLATTAFVMAAVTASTTGVASFNTRTGAVTLQQSDVTAVGAALTTSPTFTGVPHAPTAAPGTNNTQIATTAFVEAALAGSVAGVSSFNTRTGAVVLTLADVTGTGILTDTALLGNPTAPTPPTADNDTSVATTAFVHAVVGALPPAGVSSFNTRVGAISLTAADVSAAGGALIASPTFTGIPAAPTAALGTSTTQLASTAFVQNALNALNYAPLNSPAFTGTPTGPTATAGTSNTQLATTAFVAAAISAATAGVSSFNGRTGAVTLTGADVTGTGVFTNTSLLGVPTAPTAAPGTNTTQVASTAFVAAAAAAAVANSVTSVNGRTGAVTLVAADVSAAGGALINSPTFTGTPRAPTPISTSNDTSLATTAWVMQALAAGGGVSSFNGRAGAVTLTTADITGAGGAPLNAPSFTGNAQSGFAIPAADNSNTIATTAWVTARIAAGYLPLTGGTLTGPLLIQYANPTIGLDRKGGFAQSISGSNNGLQRWVIMPGDSTTESGSNSGSNFAISRSNDAGNFIDYPLTISRATGLVTLTGDLTVSHPTPTINMVKPASGTTAGLVGYTGANQRWGMAFGNNAPEIGSNNGSDFVINRYSDGGAFIDSVFQISRMNGLTTLVHPLTISPAAGDNAQIVLSAVPPNVPQLLFARSGNITFSFVEDGSTGNLYEGYYNAAGQFLGYHLAKQYVSGSISLGATANGSFNTGQGGNSQLYSLIGGVIGWVQQQLGGALVASQYFNNSAGTTVGYIAIESNQATFVNVSDARYKENDVAFDGGRAIIEQLAVKEFDWTGTGVHDIGLIAQEAQPVYPNAVTEGHGEVGDPDSRPWGINYTKYIPILIEALQDAFREIDAIKAQLAPATETAHARSRTKRR